ELLGSFLKAAEGILAEAGEVVVSLLRGQGGTAAEAEQRRPKDTWQAMELGLEAGLLLRHVGSCPMKDLAELGYTTTGFRGQGLRDATAQVFQVRACRLRCPSSASTTSASGLAPISATRR
ncbi:Fdxacb1, partial [Symbiodinium necroappetens]